MVLSGHVWLAEKKEGIRPKRRVVAETKMRAEDWLEEQIAEDPGVAEYEVREYQKTVYYDGDDNVVGTIVKLRTKAQYDQHRQRYELERSLDELRSREAGVLGDDE